MAFKKIAKYYNIYMIPLISKTDEDLKSEMKETQDFYENYMLDHCNKICRWYTVKGWFLKNKFNINIDDSKTYLCTYLTHRHNKKVFERLNESLGNKDIFLEDLIKQYTK